MTPQLLVEVFHDVAVEPDLQLLTGQSMNYQSDITTDEARLDIRVQGFWGASSEKAYFDVSVQSTF